MGSGISYHQMGKEDQEEEIEILESIYPEELEVLGEDSIALHLLLETDQPRKLRVEVGYDEEYPEKAPRLIIDTEHAENVAGVNDDETERKYSYEFTSEDCEQLRIMALELAQENLGMPMVFTLVSAIKEQAEEMYEQRIKNQEIERLKQLHLEEEKEQAKFRGTTVTKASFSAWRVKFRTEMGWDKPRERPHGRLSGRELFERGMIADDADSDEDGDARS